jgi:hypothetical protein
MQDYEKFLNSVIYSDESTFHAGYRAAKIHVSPWNIFMMAQR